MLFISIQKTHEISCGHRVMGHESKCQRPHGHNYKFEFNCTAATLDGIGRITDFAVLKNILGRWLEETWDHKFLVYKDDPLSIVLSQFDKVGTCIVPFNPTVENMAKYFIENVAPVLLSGSNVTLHKLTVWETSKCSATVTVRV